MDWVEIDFIAALRYAVEWGGKRLRPILAMLAYEQVTKEPCSDFIIDGLIGIEFMHCYTLVHDDLPCMDNDILRRGKPTVWKAYGETMAILVGDALQSMSFERLASLGNIQVITELAHAMGHCWVVRGQVRDTIGDQSEYALEDIMRLHDEKTWGFIASTLIIGARLANASEWECVDFRNYGILLGRAFQIRDDILDYEGDRVLLGKTIGKDMIQKKWLVSLLGIEKTKSLLETIDSQLGEFLKQCDSDHFQDITKYIIYRQS